MMVKAVTFFLIGVLVLAMFGRLRLKHRLPRLGASRKRAPLEEARKCPECGGYLIGKGSCPCQKST